MTLRIENVGKSYAYVKSGVFDRGVGATTPGPIMPGGAFEVSFTAPRGSKLSFATMFAQSNDLFFAPDEDGIPLFDDAGNPKTGDITSYVRLWDVGSELNEEPGRGPNQAPRQTAPNTGAADPNSHVRLAENTFGNLPSSVRAVLLATLRCENGVFTLRIQNCSTASTLATSDGATHAVPLSPGVFVVHDNNKKAPLFQSGQPDRGEGLAAIAEDGNPAALGAALAANTGVTVPISPGVFVVHTALAPIFTPNAVDRGLGLEAIAEDGNPALLAASLGGKPSFATSGAFMAPIGAATGPALPGAAFEVTFAARPNDRLSFATMFGESNDLFFAPGPDGIALYDANGGPRSGDVSAEVQLWEAGTERNEEPGIGSHQAPRQLAPNSGPAESEVVRLAPKSTGAYVYPAASSVMRVTLRHAP